MNQRSAFVQEHLKPLVSLRFVAALLVFAYYCTPTAAIGTAYALGHAAASLTWGILVGVILNLYCIVVGTACVTPPIRIVDFLLGMMVPISVLLRRDANLVKDPWYRPYHSRCRCAQCGRPAWSITYASLSGPARVIQGVVP
jgi:hypothetical protein